MARALTASRVLRVAGIVVLAALLALPTPAPRASGTALAAPEGAAPVTSVGTATAASVEGAASTQGLTRVNVGMQYIMSDAALLIADDLGYMREAGIEVAGERMENVPLQNSLAIGQIDVGGLGPTAALLNAVVRGVRLKIVADRATLAQGHGYLAMIVRKDLYDSGQVRTIADLRGRRVSPQPPLHATISWYLLEKLLLDVGLTTNDVHYEPLGFADQNAALLAGTIDAAWAPEPGPTQVVEAGLAVRIATGDQAVSPFSLGGLAYSEQFAAQTDPARRFMVGYLRGIRAYLDAFTKNQGRARVVDVLTRTTALRDAGMYDRMQVPWIHPDGYFNTNAYDRVQDYFIRHGTLTQAVDFNQLVDHSFVEYARAQLGPY
jgi:NitT/TauT family transport system substrate-binding protein